MYIRPFSSCLFVIIILNGVIFTAYGKPIYFNVKEYGATGNGETLDTKAINNTVDAAAKAGGGTVYFPAGKYLTGSIHLQSNITLYLDAGSTIIASDSDTEGVYDEIEKPANSTFQDFGHSYFHNSLIWGSDLHDVTICGTGTIWGKGLLKDYKKDTHLANKTIAMIRCRNVIIKDISILHGGWFALLLTGVDNLTIDNIKLDTNRDGMDIDCCKNVRVSNCFVNSPYDDGICLKSSFALGYARSTENVTITNCQVSGYDEGTLLDGTYKRTKNAEYGTHPTGRIKFGTESNGGFKNVAISNCVFDYCRGLALETVDGALLEDVTISNITMRDVVNDPIFLRLGARMRGPKETPAGELRRVLISNINIYNADPDHVCTITGIPGHDVKDVELNEIHLWCVGGKKSYDANITVPENENKYPEPGMFGTPPAYGFFVRHASGISFKNIKINLLNADARPAFYFSDVKNSSFNNVSTSEGDSNKDQLIIKNSSGIKIKDSFMIPDQSHKNIDNKKL
jgi:polygalacturonase